MYVGKNFKLSLVLSFAWPNLLITFAWSTLVVGCFQILNWKFLAIPFLPIGTIGTAVAFFLGFKNNQAYDRLWEARRLWGGMTNTSRMFCYTLLALLSDKDANTMRDILFRHLSYVNVLRLQLRRHIAWATTQFAQHRSFVSDADELQDFHEGLKEILTRNNKTQYYDLLSRLNNPAAAFIKTQIDCITQLKRKGVIDDYEHSDLLKHLNEFLNLQGGCERIKTTPLFRQFSIFSRIFVKLFILLLPFGLLKDLASIATWGVWLCVPFCMLISWVFFTMEQIGEYSENPFDNSINDIPISSITRNIEIDILEMLGEKNIPSKINPQNDILL
ncbi:MAG: hypothetical protein EAZ57_08620 [Cytophagales bacterium]|nr:MAG: hypothetical protein EAZ67_09430 [Cytophagales bacterium]TAF60089.1 MAG: hypothetical protein EAZ57_08620 [Cytophagales bacterium]